MWSSSRSHRWAATVFLESQPEHECSKILNFYYLFYQFPLKLFRVAAHKRIGLPFNFHERLTNCACLSHHVQLPHILQHLIIETEMMRDRHFISFVLTFHCVSHLTSPGAHVLHADECKCICWMIAALVVIGVVTDVAAWLPDCLPARMPVWPFACRSIW